jgi:phage-related protein
MEILFFNEKVETFIADLEKPTIAKALRILDLLEKYPKDLGMPYSKKMTKNIYELRVRGKQELRIFYVFSEKNIVLLHAFIKKKQKTPLKEISLAKKRLKKLGKST